MIRMMVRPRWIAALVLALAISAAFAALGQWQLARAISSGEVVERSTETVQPLSDTVSSARPDDWQYVQGALFVIVLAFIPGGLMGIVPALRQRVHGLRRGEVRIVSATAALAAEPTSEPAIAGIGGAS